MANADEKAPEIDESGVKDGSGKEPETDSNRGSKELEKKYSEADVEAIFNRKFSQKMRFRKEVRHDLGRTQGQGRRAYDYKKAVPCCKI